jgi:hypothetical protein
LPFYTIQHHFIPISYQFYRFLYHFLPFSPIFTIFTIFIPFSPFLYHFHHFIPFLRHFTTILCIFHRFPIILPPFYAIFHRFSIIFTHFYPFLPFFHPGMALSALDRAVLASDRSIVAQLLGGGARREWVAVAVFAVANGLTSGSGRVAVGWLERVCHCGHFDRWQVENPFFVMVAVAGWLCLQWQWLNEWQWRSGSGLVGTGVAVRSF